MSADGSVTLNWADGTYKFRLAIGQLRELQETVNRSRVKIGAKPVGPKELMDLIGAGEWWIDDIRETIRIGLIGGGEVKPVAALDLVRRYVDERPPMENQEYAVVILMSALIGDPDDPVGKPSAERTETKAMDALSSPPSTETGKQSGSTRKK